MTVVAKFTVGVLWEDFPAVIEYDHRMEYMTRYDAPCPHAHSFGRKRYPEFGGKTYSKKCWTVPRVVVASNEGGYNTTGVCLDCLLEVVKTLPPAKLP